MVGWVFSFHTYIGGVMFFLLEVFFFLFGCFVSGRYLYDNGGSIAGDEMLRWGSNGREVDLEIVTER